MVTPLLQNYFWRRQRHAEIGLAALHKLHELAAEFEWSLLGAPETYSLIESAQLGKGWHAAVAELQALFSSAACEQLNVLTSTMNKDWDSDDIGEFVELRRRAFTPLYTEIGVISRARWRHCAPQKLAA